MSTLKPLTNKLGIKPGFKVTIINPPENYERTLGGLPQDVTVSTALQGPLDFIHFFTRSREELTHEFPKLKRSLAPKGMVWISWPKRSSKLETDLNENTVREIGLSNGLVDVKVCAIDETWSGLKFVYRVRDRK